MSLNTDTLQQLLLTAKLATKEKLTEFATIAQETERDFADVVIENQIITKNDLGKLIAKHYNVGYVDLVGKEIPQDATEIISAEVAKRLRVICFSNDPAKGLFVATDMVEENTLFPSLLEKKTGKKVTMFFASSESIDHGLTTYMIDFQLLFDRFLRDDDTFVIKTTSHDPPVMKMVDQLIEVAHEQGASDIHIEPREEDFLVRFRIDGILHDIFFLRKNLHDRVVTRIKVLSRLRTDLHLAAQDGKMTMMIGDDRLDLRISIIPVAEGEKVVARLLTSKARSYSLADLGFSEQALAHIEHAYKQSYGMILSTGPTGSGKTTSMYSILKNVNTRELNLTSIEDPIEYRMPGANQVQVNVKADLTFANGLRSLLRQDPDVIFVGEIRDTETANIAVNAALTGHLVLSTLHTNNAATTLPRLFDMGVEPFLVASTVRVIIGQRLVRKICPHCKKSESIAMDELQRRLGTTAIPNLDTSAKKPIMLYHGAGCRMCHKTGYQGRVGIYEVLNVSPTIRQLVADSADADTIHKQAVQEGMATMFEDGVQKVLAGLTTVTEILRVTRTEDVT